MNNYPKNRKSPTPRTKEHSDKISMALIGHVVSEETKNKIRKELTSKPHPHKGVKGEKNNNWKGGITPLYNKIYGSFEYRLWRSDIYKRDRYKCQECDSKKHLRSHHIKTTKEIISEYNIETFEEAIDCVELWDINNGQTLCQDCHRKKHFN